MGSYRYDPTNEMNHYYPEHNVYLDKFKIGRYEITNLQYAQCVKANVCLNSGTSLTESQPKLPVVNINWYDAKTFCNWVGGDLPTEAQWEKAARGGLEDELYPWGSDAPICSVGAVNGANYRSCTNEVMSVGSFAPNGFGLYDMAGNVWEMVTDWFDRSYYQNSPYENPTGPVSGKYRVVRGGAWNSYENLLRVARRSTTLPNSSYSHEGFRCVLNQP